MDRFEKVIKALQLTKSNPVEGWNYHGEGFDGAMVHTSTALIDAALALINAQQERIKELEAGHTARVMTLEEVIKHYSLPPVVLDDLCWQEDYLQDIEPLYFDFPVEDSFAVHWRGYQSVRKYLEDWKASYGQKWRCWTQRPTDEQRKAAEWE